MAPAAADLIEANYKDFEVTKGYYDMIITGDLGYTGKEILLTLLKEKGIDISDIYTDCGIEVFDKNEQDTQSGGSGCGCSAIVLDTLVLDKLRKRELKRVLFVPTGALLSQVSFNEGKSIPGFRALSIPIPKSQALARPKRNCRPKARPTPSRRYRWRSPAALSLKTSRATASAS